ncbi:MAG: DsbA family protein [Rickettsiales bacterium]|nr:DsbA family protein [Rickettsiales bacterium]
MKLSFSVMFACALFVGSIWMADSLQAAPDAAKKPAASGEEKAEKNPLEAKAPPVAPEKILTQQSTDIVLGQATAPVTMFEYSSLSCPHCAHFHQKILPVLQKDFIDSGKVKLVIRQFPTSASALQAALLVRCLPPTQGLKFEEVLFELQDRWAFTTNSRDALLKIAQVGGVSEAQFNACLDDKSAESALLADLISVRDNLGVKATPTFFIGTDEIQGAQTPEEFSKHIQAALAKLKP